MTSKRRKRIAAVVVAVAAAEWIAGAVAAVAAGVRGERLGVGEVADGAGGDCGAHHRRKSGAQN